MHAMSPSDAVAIRLALPQDGERVAAMCAMLSAEEGEPAPAFSAQAFRRDGFGPAAQFGCLVADRAGEVVGYLLHCPDYDTDLMRRCLYVADLFVEKTARGMGAGHALMAGAASIARARGSRLMAWTVLARNRQARRFYARFGEEQADTVLFSTHGPPFEDLAAAPAPEHVRLRPAEAADAPTIASMQQALLEGQGDLAPPDLAEAFLRDGFGADPAFRVLVAEREGRIAGFALYWLLYETELAGPGAMLSDLYVDPAARRAGIGRTLVAEVARQTRAAGGKFMMWPARRHNAPALAFHATVARQEADAILCRCAGEAFERLAAAARIALPA